MLPAHHKQHVHCPQVWEGVTELRVCGDCNLLGSAEQADEVPCQPYGLDRALHALAAAPHPAGHVPRCCVGQDAATAPTLRADQQYMLTQALHHAHDVALAVLAGAQH